MRRPRLVVALAAIAVSAAALTAWNKHEKRIPDSSTLALPLPGREAMLHVTWHEKSTARLRAADAAGLADTIPGELELEADLVLARETTTSGEDAVRAELRDVKKSRVVISGQEVLEGEGGRASIERQSVHLVLGDGGRVARVLVDKDAPSLAVSLTENVARQVLLPQPKAEAFDRDEETPSGAMRVHYEPKRGEAATLERTVTAALDVTGMPERCKAPCRVRARSEGIVQYEAEAAGGGGPIRSFHDKRELRAGEEGAPAMFETTASFEATRTREGAAEPATLDPSKLASKLPGEVFENEADKRASLGRLASGATLEDVLSGVTAMATGRASDLPKGWVVRSTALLELHPELLAEVAVRFEDDTMGAGARMAILDLLAATGGDAAKVTLLKVLDSAAARHDDSRLAFVQRMVLVEEPSGAFAAAIRGRLAASQARGDSDMAYAEAHVLGAMAGRLAARGAPADAKASVSMLAAAVDASNAPPARAAYLSALGNAGDLSQVGRIAKHANDAEPKVRRAVASALRKTKSPEARSTLLALAKDSDEEVSVAALDALAVQGLEPSDGRELASLLDTSRLGGEAEGQVVTMLLRQGPPSPEIRASLEQLLARTEDPRLAARVRLALEAQGTPN